MGVASCTHVLTIPGHVGTTEGSSGHGFEKMFSGLSFPNGVDPDDEEKVEWMEVGLDSVDQLKTRILFV